MTIYEIDSAIMDLIDPETGEILDEEAFSALHMAREKKIENLALYIKNLSAEARAIQDEIATLTERRDKVKKKAQSLEAYLARVLDGMKFRTARCVVSWRKSNALVVDDDLSVVGWALENGYDACVIQHKPTVSKKAVTELIKAGVDVPHARIVENMNMGVK